MFKMDALVKMNFWHFRNSRHFRSWRLFSNNRYWKSFQLFKSFLSFDIPKKIGFSLSFLEWIEAVLKNQELCVINSVQQQRILYYKKEHAKDGDPISDYLFILVLEILFYLIKTKIESLNICDSFFLYSAYVDDTTTIWV